MTGIRSVTERMQSRVSEGPPAQASAYRRRWAALAVLCVSLLIVTLDNTVLNVVPAPTLVRDLHATTASCSGSSMPTFIVFAGLLLSAGSVADRLGRKRTFLAGLVAFAVGSDLGRVLRIGGNADRGAGQHGHRRRADHAVDSVDHHRTCSKTRANASGRSACGQAPRVPESRSARSSAGLLLAHFWWGSVFLINVPLAVARLRTWRCRWCPTPAIPRGHGPTWPAHGLSIAGLGLPALVP